VHERSTDPDVMKRLRAETEWTVKAHRRYVELTWDDAVALQARISELTARVELLTTVLHELAATADRVCRQVADGTEVDWTGLLRNKVANARAALAAGETESEA
jgi:hypothetical protein